MTLYHHRIAAIWEKPVDIQIIKKERKKLKCMKSGRSSRVEKADVALLNGNGPVVKQDIVRNLARKDRTSSFQRTADAGRNNREMFMSVLHGCEAKLPSCGNMAILQ